MTRPMTLHLLMALLWTAAPAHSAEFSCERIKDKQVRNACIHDRTEHEKSSAAASAPHDLEAAAASEKANAHDLAVKAALQALKELKRLEVRVNTGVSYADYPALLANAKFEVQQFTDSRDATLLPEAVSAMTSALEHYDDARILWNYQFADGGVPARVVSTALPGEGKYVEQMAEKYKGIAENDGAHKRIWIDQGIVMVWAAASRDILETQKYLQ